MITPGEWGIEKGRNSFNGANIVSLGGSNGKICICSTWGTGDSEQDRSNAVLIAIAPILLQTIKDIIKASAVGEPRLAVMQGVLKEAGLD